MLSYLTIKLKKQHSYCDLCLGHCREFRPER